MKNYTIFDVNDALIDLLGYRYEELVGHTSDEIGLWTKSKERKIFFKNIRQTGSVRNQECHFHVKDGREIIVLVSAMVTEIKGQPCILSSFMDITEQKKAQDQRLKEIERLTIILKLYEKARRMTVDGIYGFVLDQMVKLTGSSIGFLHHISTDQKNITLSKWSPKTLENRTTLRAEPLPIEKAGIWRDCFQLKQAVICND